MLSLNMLIKELESRGFDCRKQDLSLDPEVKGKKNLGLVIKTGDANGCLVIPIYDVLNTAPSVLFAADQVQKRVESSLLPDQDYSRVLNRQYILENVRLGFCKNLWTPYLTRESELFRDILEYCFISGVVHNTYWIIEMRDDILADCGISQEELWHAAIKNLSGMKIEPVEAIMGKSFQQFFKNSPLKYVYSITNQQGLNGAGQIYNRGLNLLFDQHKVSKLIVYPQSKNNFLVGIPFDGVQEALINIARNDTNNQRLSDFIYVISRNDSDELVLYEDVYYRDVE